MQENSQIRAVQVLFVIWLKQILALQINTGRIKLKEMQMHQICRKEVKPKGMTYHSLLKYKK
jgi:hypothetical protein